MANDLESLALTISADTRQIQRALKRLEGDTASSAKRIEQAFDAPTKGLGRLQTAMAGFCQSADKRPFSSYRQVGR